MKKPVVICRQPLLANWNLENVCNVKKKTFVKIKEDMIQKHKEIFRAHKANTDINEQQYEEGMLLYT